jgi:hypothetical protein
MHGIARAGQWEIHRRVNDIHSDILAHKCFGL